MRKSGVGHRRDPFYSNFMLGDLIPSVRDGAKINSIPTADFP